MSNLKRNAVIYYRTKSILESHPKHEKACRLLAEKQGYTVIDVFYDVEKETDFLDHSSMKCMLGTLLLSRVAGAVIVPSLIALSHEKILLPTIFEFLSTLGIKVLCVDGNKIPSRELSS